MENCSVKQYRTPANNSNLEYFNALQVKINWSLFTESNLLVVYNHVPQFGGAGCTLRVLSNGVIGTSASATDTEYTITGEESYAIRIYPVNNNLETEFIVVGLSKITMLKCGASNGVYMKNPLKQVYCSNLLPINGILMNFKAYKDGDNVDMSEFFASFAHKSDVTTLRESARDTGYFLTYCSTDSLKDYVNLTAINLYLCVNYGNVSNLSNLKQLTSLYLKQHSVVGQITSLGNMTKLTYLNLTGSTLEGAIEDFVAAQYNASSEPRKSASGATRIKMDISGSNNITLNGTKFTCDSKYLAWDDGGSAPTNIRIENS